MGVDLLAGDGGGRRRHPLRPADRRRGPSVRARHRRRTRPRHDGGGPRRDLMEPGRRGRRADGVPPVDGRRLASRGTRRAPGSVRKTRDAGPRAHAQPRQRVRRRLFLPGAEGADSRGTDSRARSGSARDHPRCGPSEPGLVRPGARVARPGRSSTRMADRASSSTCPGTSPTPRLARLPPAGESSAWIFIPGHVARNGAPGGLDDVVAHVEHWAGLVGPDHVGFGGDFDGIPSTLAGVETAAVYPALLAALAARGFSPADLERIAWRNWIRVLRSRTAVSLARVAGA